MKETVKDLWKKLLLQVRKMRKNPAAYASWLGSDFTRRRTPSFEKVVLILLTISCESLGKNLMKVFRFQEKAFVQSLGGAISQLYRFSFSRKKYGGHHLLAADGMSLKSSVYPADPLSYLPGTDRRHRWNKHLINAPF